MATTTAEACEWALARRAGLPGRAILLACTGLLIGLSGALAFHASASEQAGQPRPVASNGTQPGVTLAPSRQSKRAHRVNAQSGRVSVFAGTLDFLIHVAYDVLPRDIVYEIELDRAALYDVVAIPPDQQAETATAMMREKLQTTFGFAASFEQRLVATRILRRVDGVSPLQESSSAKSQINRRKGRFSGTRISMDDLVEFTLSVKPGRIVDETELDGVYDLVMEWDPSGGGNTWLQAFQDLGLELVRGKRSFEQLVISPAKTQPEARPDE